MRTSGQIVLTGLLYLCFFESSAITKGPFVDRGDFLDIARRAIRLLEVFNVEAAAGKMSLLEYHQTTYHEMIRYS